MKISDDELRTRSRLPSGVRMKEDLPWICSPFMRYRKEEAKQLEECFDHFKADWDTEESYEPTVLTNEVEGFLRGERNRKGKDKNEH